MNGKRVGGFYSSLVIYEYKNNLHFHTNKKYSVLYIFILILYDYN